MNHVIMVILKERDLILFLDYSLGEMCVLFSSLSLMIEFAFQEE